MNRVTLYVLIASLFGCPANMDPIDGGPGVDGGPGIDAGPVFDGGGDFDGGPGFDAGPAIDAASPDAGSGSSAIHTIEIEALTTSSATISWHLNVAASGSVEYGLTADYGEQTPGETRPLDFHRQRLEPLTAATTYHYRILAEDPTGLMAVSEDATFTTPERVIPTPVEGWPSEVAAYNEDLPMSGIFYGHPMAGTYGAANSSISVESGWRFRAERTGNITAVAWQNRYLSSATIESRCNTQRAGTPNNDWCRCVDNGLSGDQQRANQCAYTLGSSYHVGNGGHLQVHIYPERGDSGQPDESNLLARMDDVFVPTEHRANIFPAMELSSPAAVVAGRNYFVVIKNLAPPTTALSRLSFADARNVDPNVGGFSLNGLYTSQSPEQDERLGPFFGTSTRTMHRNATSGPWIINERVMGWWEVRYDDETWLGHAWACPDCAFSGTGRREVEGNLRARQTFTVQRQTRQTTGVWVSYGHPQTRTSGDDMRVELKDASGTVLHSGSVPYERAVNDQAIEAPRNNLASGYPTVWRYVEFPSTIPLNVGETYHLEFSAPANAGFTMATYIYKHMERNALGRPSNRNEWEDAQAEISEDGGSSWDFFVPPGYFSERDLPVLFTIEGMPAWLP